MQAFIDLSPQSRVQLGPIKVLDAIFLPLCALYRSICSTFDSISERCVR